MLIGIRQRESCYGGLVSVGVRGSKNKDNEFYRDRERMPQVHGRRSRAHGPKICLV